MSQPVYYVSPVGDKCQLCSGFFNGRMFDARINGRWGNICFICFKGHGCRLGTGSGQEYTKQFDGRWLKTRG